MSGPAIRFVHPFRFPSDHAHSIQILNTCRALAEEGARVTIDVKRNPAKPTARVEDGLRLYGLDPHPGLEIRWLPGTGNAITGFFARWRIWRAKNKPVFYVRHLRLAAPARGRGPVIVELHALRPDTEEAVRAADGIVTITSALGEEIRRRYQPKVPMAVVPDAVDVARFRPAAQSGPLRLAYMGQMTEIKGVDVLIRALRLLPGVPALIIGGRDGQDADRERLKALAQSEGVADRIEWTGFLPQTEIPGRLRKGDLGILPTRAMGGEDLGASPLKLFEYLASGLPVVASDMPALRDIIRPGENGLLFKEGDPAALADAVRTLVDKPETRESLARGALQTASSHTWRDRARRILAFVKPFLSP